MKLQRLSVLDIVAIKRRGERIAALTAYDYTSAPGAARRRSALH